MKRKPVLYRYLGFLFIAAFLSACVGAPKPSGSNFKDPIIALERVEISYYAGYYYFSDTVKPTRGKSDNFGAPLLIDFIYEIRNPNSYPVMLDEFTFAVLFEEFVVNTVSSPEKMWIPAGKTNQLRVPAMFDTRQTFLSIQLAGALKLKEKSITAWGLLEKWWTRIPDFSFPISAHQGSAVFTANGLTQVVPFNATFP